MLETNPSLITEIGAEARKLAETEFDLKSLSSKLSYFYANLWRNDLRLFVLLSRFPYPLEKGDKLRAFHQLRILSKHHEVFLCALHENDLEQNWIEEVQQYCSELQTIRISKFNQIVNLGFSLLGNEPFQVAYFYQKAAQKYIEPAVEAPLKWLLNGSSRAAPGLGKPLNEPD